MTIAERFTLSGTAIPVDAKRMLDEICEHFIEHAEVHRYDDGARLETVIGNAEIRIVGEKLAIELICPEQKFIISARSMIAEHLFEFAGEEPLELFWAQAPNPDALPSFREATVVGTADITPHMRRVTVSCRNVEQFVGVGLHVRLFIPQGITEGKAPVWPGMLADGRVAWPDEKDIAVRVYTIRGIDIERGELDIDFVLHEGNGVSMPGADFAMNTQAGDLIGIMGPGGDGIATAASIILAGDEAALPAICRMAAEAPAGSNVRIFVEVDGPAEEQPLTSPATLDIRWLHRNGGKAGTMRLLEPCVQEAAQSCPDGTYIWAGCEKTEARAIRDFLKARGHDRKLMSISAYWQKPRA